MFGTILVSMTGMALPVLAGMWLIPRSEHPRSPPQLKSGRKAGEARRFYCDRPAGISD